jgi:hypothetical protein
MATQEQAFRAYYSSMTNEELLAIAANRNSFIDVAQKAMSEELSRRNLTAPTEPDTRQRVKPDQSVSSQPSGLLGTLKRLFLH